GQPGPDAVDNVGIVAFNALRDDQRGGAVQVFVRVLNFRKRETEVKVKLRWRVLNRDDEGLDFQKTTLEGRTVRPPDPDRHDPAAPGGARPGGGVSAFELGKVPASDTVLLEANLDDHQDQFPLDDRAWLVLGVARKARVLIVTDGSSSLRKPFGTEAVSRIA